MKVLRPLATLIFISILVYFALRFSGITPPKNPQNTVIEHNNDAKAEPKNPRKVAVLAPEVRLLHTSDSLKISVNGALKTVESQPTRNPKIDGKTLSYSVKGPRGWAVKIVNLSAFLAE